MKVYKIILISLACITYSSVIGQEYSPEEEQILKHQKPGGKLLST